MKVRVDITKCQGHGRCEALCPEVFAIADDDVGKSVVKLETVPPELEGTASRAVDSCPEGALESFE